MERAIIVSDENALILSLTLLNPEGMIRMAYNRITVNSRMMDGVPCIRALRIPVATVVGMVAEGMTEKDILNAYPDLESADIREALRYAAAAVREREIPLLQPA